jgi:hypothetical protein
VLDRGTVVRSGTIGAIRAAVGNRYQLGWQGEGARFLDSLTRLGVRVVEGSVEGKAMVTVPSGWNTTAFFQSARSSGVVLVHLKADEEDLERLFFRVTNQSRPAMPPMPVEAVIETMPVAVGPETTDEH